MQHRRKGKSEDGREGKVEGQEKCTREGSVTSCCKGDERGIEWGKGWEGER
jgi:hypothetical protein